MKPQNNEDLASHGYFVIASDAPYSTTVAVLDDGQVITRTSDGNPGHLTDVAERDRALEHLVDRVPTSPT